MAVDKQRSNKSGSSRGASSSRGGKPSGKPAFERREKPERDHVKDYSFGDKKKRDGKQDDKDKKKYGGAVDFQNSAPARGGGNFRGRGGSSEGRGGRGGSRGGRGGFGGGDRGGKPSYGGNKPDVKKVMTRGQFEEVK